MFGVKIASLGSHSHKTLVRAAVQAYCITLLSSTANGNPCDIHKKLFIMLRSKDSSVRISFPQNASLECCSIVSRPLCSHQNATEIVICTKCFSL